jgi:hypothetical protein
LVQKQQETVYLVLGSCRIDADQSSSDSRPASREAAQEYSPQREPWESDIEKEGSARRRERIAFDGADRSSQATHMTMHANMKKAGTKNRSRLVLAGCPDKLVVRRTQFHWHMTLET